MTNGASRTTQAEVGTTYFPLKLTVEGTKKSLIDILPVVGSLERDCALIDRSPSHPVRNCYQFGGVSEREDNLCNRRSTVRSASELIGHGVLSFR